MKIIVVISAFLHLSVIDGKKFTLEAEKYAIQRQRVMTRSNASSKNSVWMHKGEQIRLEFCLEKQSTVQIFNIRYSNDGPSDTVDIRLDDHVIGSFISISSSHEGFDWNAFHDTDKVGNAKSLSSGRHVITADLSSSDQFGMEFDAVILDINDPDLKEETFRCTLYCFDDIDYSDAARRDDVSSATFVQQSYRTLCTEEDNVRLDIYHEEANKFRITAMQPKYRTFSNRREPDFSGCPLVDSFWEFKDILLGKVRGELQSSGAIASFSGSSSLIHILITFSAKGVTINNKENNGNILYMRMKNVQTPLRASLAYVGKSRRWIVAESKIFNKDKTEMIWQLQNKSWANTRSNLMQVTLYSNTLEDATIEEFRLSPDSKKGSSKVLPFAIFQNSDFIVEGVNVDSWWLGNSSMTIKRTDNGQSFKNVECLRIQLKEPWSDAYSQVFSLCQDGCMRLLPVTPHGLDWIPFGSTIIIGQSNPNDKKPYAALSNIDIDPGRLNMKLRFHDKTTVTLEIEPSRFETSVKITEYNYAKDRKKFPALTFKSMWVANGRSDVDHMTINGDEARPIMADTGRLHGISAVFFRKCISSHNTLSPDIKIEVLGNGD